MGLINLTCDCGETGRVRVIGDALASKTLDIIVTCNGCGEPQRVTVDVQASETSELASERTRSERRKLVRVQPPPAP